MCRSLTPAQRRILQQYVQETEAPGSTPFSSGSYTSPSASGSSSTDSPSAASDSSSGATSTAPPSSPRVDADAPGFTQQARPPPSDTETRSSKPQWWTTMSDDITSTAPLGTAAEPDIEDKLEDAKHKFEEVAKEEVNNLEREAAGAAAESQATESKAEASPDSDAVKKDKPTEDGDHTLLGDLWKGAKKWFGPK